MAPGVGTESLSAPGSAFYNSMPAYLLNGTVPTSYLPYLSLSGTSMAAPVVAGTVALMLQVNPSLTPNEVKAILEYTAQTYHGYDALTQGAGFLNARGAVELAHYFGSPSDMPYPSTDGWSGRIIWGNYRLQGGQLTPDATAWQGVSWGAEPTATNPISWGVICTDSCDGGAPVWSSWAASCLDPLCASINWSGGARNVVWGTTCASSCASSGTGYASGTAVVWGSSDAGDAVVWGSNDGSDAVVWGSSCTDPSCKVVWQN